MNALNHRRFCGRIAGAALHAVCVGFPAVAFAGEEAGPINLSISSPGPGEISLNWQTIPGCPYSVHSSNGLSAWGPLVSCRLPALATSSTMGINLLAVDPVCFFKVAVSKSPYDPDWEGAAPLRTIPIAHDGSKSDQENGAALKAAMLALVPGDRLEIGSGTYDINSLFKLDLQGTAEAPIWIAAAPDAAVVVTRPNANQNLVNVGVDSEARYLCFEGIEFKGGSHGIRLYDCSHVWINRCEIHSTGDVGLSANARDTDRLHITRNEIRNTGGTGEGMYLGGNNASVIMSESVIALNHVHHTNGAGVSQGDGIEVKQGSWGNVIAGNHVHDCKYPCILVYGTGGKAVNIVENNVCYGSGDNAMQIQGECIVRNNLVMKGGGNAFASQVHQGQPTKLTVVHNTFINTGNAARLSGWAAGADMVFANNGCYSRDGNALHLAGSAGSAVFAGNVNHGAIPGGQAGFSPGTGLGDFVDVAWDASKRDAKPSESSPLRSAATTTHATATDIDHLPRKTPHTAGCHGP